MSKIKKIIELSIITIFVLIINTQGNSQDKKDICRHRGAVTQKSIDIEQIIASYRNFETAVKQSLRPRVRASDFKFSWADVKSCMKSRIRGHKISEGKIPAEFLGNKFLFTDSQTLRNIPDRKTKVFIVARPGSDLRSIPDLENEVYFASGDILKIFGVECIPSLVALEDENSLQIEEISR